MEKITKIKSADFDEDTCCGIDKRLMRVREAFEVFLASVVDIESLQIDIGIISLLICSVLP